MIASVDTAYSNSQTDFMVLRTNTILDNYGYLHLFGELKNISNEPTENIIIFATFFDVLGIPIGNASASTAIRNLNSGYTSPFELLLLDKNVARNVHDFSLQIKSDRGVEKNYLLEFTSVRPRLDIFGFYYIYGKVVNDGNETATNSLIISAFYDKNGKIIEITKAMAEPVNITTGYSASFSILMDKKEESHKIRNFSLIADSDQYLSPE
ncbi:MAG: hypothetical protein M3530_02695 [Thermoproteota archaeon]|nr:hypothetical protein [Thermoproteota archaeon]